MVRADLIGGDLKTLLIHCMCQFQYFLSFFEISHILKMRCYKVSAKKFMDFGTFDRGSVIFPDIAIMFVFMKKIDAEDFSFES